MHLLRYQPRIKDLRLPNGRLVKIEVNDTATAQHVHDWEDRTHATARPDPVAMKVGHLGTLRADGTETKGRKRFVQDADMELWVPLEGGDR